MPARSMKLELKAVDTRQRVITAYCATFGVVDRQGEVIAPDAFDRSLRSKKLADISVLVGHDPSRMPVGTPLAITADAHGLLTKTKVFATDRGEELLQAARELRAAGSSLGLSIGYSVIRDGWGQVAGKSARILKDLTLFEYSFLPSPEFAANPEARVVDIKAAASSTTLYEVVNAVVVVPDRLRRAADLAAAEARDALRYPYWLVPKWVVPAAPGASWKSADHQRVHGPSNVAAFYVKEYVGSLFLKVDPTLSPWQVGWGTAHESYHAHQHHAGLKPDELEADRFAYALMDSLQEDDRWA